jgi:hypothetical protein
MLANCYGFLILVCAVQGECRGNPRRFAAFIILACCFSLRLSSKLLRSPVKTVFLPIGWLWSAHQV